MKIALSAEEIEKYGIKQNKSEDGRVWVEWSPEFDRTRVDISISEAEITLISREIMRLDQQNKLNVNSLPLYDYFVDGKEPEET